MNLSVAELKLPLATPLPGRVVAPLVKPSVAGVAVWDAAVLVPLPQDTATDAQQGLAQPDAQGEPPCALVPMQGAIRSSADVMFDDSADLSDGTGKDRSFDSATVDQWIRKRGPARVALTSPVQQAQPLAMANLLTLADDRSTSSAMPPVAQAAGIRAQSNGALALLPVAPQAVLPARRSGDHVESMQSARAAFSSGAPLAAFDAITASQEVTTGKPANANGATTPEQRLLAALGDRISVQAGQGIQNAVIRLEPHMAGAIRIELTYEAGAMRVHITASQAEVVQQLQAIGEGMRQDLSARQCSEVTVQIQHGRGTEHGDRGDRQPGRDRDDPKQQVPGRSWGSEVAEESFDATWWRTRDSRSYTS